MPAHRTDVQTRFGDTDALGHVNNASFASYAELARLDFMSRLGRAVTSLILASLHMDFRRQVLFRDSVYVETRVGRVGTTSVTLLQTVVANDERAADIRSVVVYFDYAAGKPRPLTDEMRATLTPFLESDAPSSASQTAAADGAAATRRALAAESAARERSL
ncbi:MAG TPA: thioesterase family protein [Gemmatimonadaceae bacterium]|nr:thioesterase family protein [Gemmatimonadaceae bacterium]